MRVVGRRYGPAVVIGLGETGGLHGRGCLRWDRLRRRVEPRPWVAVFALAACVVLARVWLGGAFGQQVWAEDGFVLLVDARTGDGLQTLIKPYGGYVELLPRALAEGSTALPMSAYAMYALITSTLIAAGCAAFVFAVARARGLQPLPAALAGLCLVIAPAHGIETLGAITNVQWFLIPAAAMAWPAGDSTVRAFRWLAPTMILLATLSTPLTLLTLPIALVARRNRTWRANLVALAAGLAVQVAGVMLVAGSPDNMSRHPGISAPMMLGWLARIGRFAPYGLPLSLRIGIEVVLGFLILVGIEVAVRSAAAPRLPATIAGTGALLLVVPSVMSGLPSARYAAVGSSLLGVAAIWSLPGNRRAVIRPVATLLAAATVVGFAASPMPRIELPWSQQVAAWQGACERNPQDQPPPFSWSPAGWASSRLPCSALRR